MRPVFIVQDTVRGTLYEPKPNQEDAIRLADSKAGDTGRPHRVLAAYTLYDSSTGPANGPQPPGVR